LELRPWTLLFAGAAACVAACVFLIWRITVTGDTSVEWMIWVLVLLGFGFFAGGYLSEAKYGREHPEDYGEIVPEQ
jgi:pheromone shutdown protein TraB